MKRLHLQAVLYFLVPALSLLLVGLPYLMAGHLHRALTTGVEPVDVITWAFLLVAVAIPPLWGYRLTVRLAEALSQTTEVVRRVAEGDFSRTLAPWAPDVSEMLALKQGINATATHLQKRLSELSLEKTRMDAILQHMADGVLLIDGHKKIVLMNPAAEQMLGVTAREAVGKDHLEVTHHFDLDEKLQQVLRTGEGASLEIRRARPETQILEARLAPAGREPERGVLLVLRDITRSRQLEQMRTEFVASVTHELRTPLTSIRGFAETLLEGALDEPETSRHFVTIIKRESEHLGALIEDLLDLSRIESGKFRMKREKVELQSLVPETVGRLAQKAETNGIELTMEVPAGLPAIPGDRDRLAQVLINLVDNAVKYTPAGGQVKVTARDEGSQVRISVADTGVGIPQLDLPRIFERFYRVDKARSRATGGTGLGLSIVKHIVEAHRGSITVQSQVGVGSTFTILLPKD
ncbi:MAG: two-component system histidine kinase PnpS [Bacillota bacterium]